MDDGLVEGGWGGGSRMLRDPDLELLQGLLHNIIQSTSATMSNTRGDTKTRKSKLEAGSPESEELDGDTDTPINTYLSTVLSQAEATLSDEIETWF